MARPKLPEHDKLSASIRVRMTDAELAKLEARANGRTLSSLVRRALFRRQKEPIAVDMTELRGLVGELHLARVALAKVGVLVNQIAKHANTTGRIGQLNRLSETMERIEAAAKPIERLAQKIGQAWGSATDGRRDGQER